MAREFKVAPGGAFAYRPGQLIVPRNHVARGDVALKAAGKLPPGPASGHRGPVRGGRFQRYKGVKDTLEAHRGLAIAGVPAQVNHVLFSTDCCSGCGQGTCPPHPSMDGADDFYKAHPFYANPFYANPFYANPFYANPFYANPFYANPFYANPFYANVQRNPGSSPQLKSTGVPRSSALPVEAPLNLPAPKPASMRVGIIDTGYAEPVQQPAAKPSDFNKTDFTDTPDADPNDTYLDTVAGHGTFITGVIDQIADECVYTVKAVVSGQGEADEVEIADALDALRKMSNFQRPHFVNMSLAGYSPLGMSVLAESVADAQDEEMIIVASAGNDASCFPTFPAALPGVIGVGALDGKPVAGKATAASFTNYGPWVRASAPGVDIVSTFFKDFTDAAGTFTEWAQWSGTSFAAPYVVGTLAVEARKLNSAGNYSSLFKASRAAVEQLIDDTAVARKPMLGAIVG